MLQLTLGVVWLGPLRHELVTAGSSVVKAAPATFEYAPGTRNSKVAATAANVVRPATGRRPGLLFIWCLPLPFPFRRPCCCRTTSEEVTAASAQCKGARPHSPVTTSVLLGARLDNGPRG